MSDAQPPTSRKARDEGHPMGLWCRQKTGRIQSGCDETHSFATYANEWGTRRLADRWLSEQNPSLSTTAESQVSKARDLLSSD